MVRYLSHTYNYAFLLFQSAAFIAGKYAAFVCFPYFRFSKGDTGEILFERGPPPYYILIFLLIVLLPHLRWQDRLRAERKRSWRELHDVTLRGLHPQGVFQGGWKA